VALRFTTLDRPAIRRLTAGQKLSESGITTERFANGDVRWQHINRVLGTEIGGGHLPKDIS
jgi:hypothetical protein